MFGAAIPVKSDESGASIHFTGPIQFTWGISLNNVELLPTRQITSRFAGRDEGEKGQYGTIGDDPRVKYSFIVFSGDIVAYRASKTGLTDRDVETFEKTLKAALAYGFTTRSKTGQNFRFYLRVETRNEQSFLDDLASYLDLENKDGLNDIHDVRLDVSKLVDYLRREKEKIEKIVYFKHEMLKTIGDIMELEKEGIRIEMLP